MSLSALALAGALALDVILGEPPKRVHPVAWFGRAVGAVDVRGSPVAGAALAVAFPAAAGALVVALVVAAGRATPAVAAAAAAVGLFVSTSFRRLLERAGEVVTLSERDPERARTRLRALAGRDAGSLSPGQVRSGAVESLAENLADGLVAPLLAYAVVAAGLAFAGVGPVLAAAAGSGAAAWVKAVNTLDSMLGYPDEPGGWAPARLDDLVVWVPARASALALAAVARSPGALRGAARWVGDVPSPNSGWPMGTLAATLDVRLEKPGVYVLNPAAPLPDPGRARAAIRQVAVAGLLVYALAGVVTWS